MKKVSTRAAAQSRNICQQKLTIGLDLGDRNSWYCVVDETGQIQLEQHNVANLRLKWQYSIGSSTTSSSNSVVNQTLYIGGMDGTVWALNANTVAKSWSYQTGDRVDAEA